MTKYATHTRALAALTASGLKLSDTLLPQNRAQLLKTPGLARKSIEILQELAREEAKRHVFRLRTPVLWLSRHEMTKEQHAELPEDVEIIHRNVTYPALGSEAASMIRQLAKDHGVKHVAGVFPAHIVAALMQECIDHMHDRYERKGLHILIPVSMPAPAREGEVRGGGFTHSHWEEVSV